MLSECGCFSLSFEMRTTALLLIGILSVLAVDAVLQYIPHCFGIDKAALLFLNDEKKQIPSPVRSQPFGRSLRKALMPLHTFKCIV